MTVDIGNLTKAYQDGVFTQEELERHAGVDFLDLVEVNPETALRVVDAFGGVRIHVASTIDPCGFLVEKIGEEHARILTDLFQGETLTVPRLMGLRREIRNRQLCRQRKNGRSINDLAHDFNLSSRQVATILSQSKSESAPDHLVEA